MYVDTQVLIRNGKRSVRHLLRESYREDGKVKKRTISCLSRCSDEEIEAIKLALKNKRDLVALKSIDDLKVTQGKSIGALHVINTLAECLGITAALGQSKQGKIALWLIYSRLVAQGSRQSSLRLAETHETSVIEDFPHLHEKALYQNLAWLSKQQLTLEKKLLKEREVNALFLYDVTSSYLEGDCNELANYGYNRDKKKGKMQIVIGLLTDDQGCPVAIRVFEGNTADTQTFGGQISLLKEDFGIDNVVIVGDGGMIKTPQQAALPTDYDYITSLSKKEIETLIQDEVIQLELFDERLCEIKLGDKRYIFRRNDVRREEIRKNRRSKEAALYETIQEQNQYLQEHPRARVEVAMGKIQDHAKKLKVDAWHEFSEADRAITFRVDQAKRQAAEKLDGCYCIKTTVSEEVADKETVHKRYKGLSQVERAFRTMKTNHLEIRPLYLRKKEHTQGHVFIVMLSYMIQRELQAAWKPLGCPVKEGIELLLTHTTTQIDMANGDSRMTIPAANEKCSSLMKALGIEPLKSLN